MFSNTFTQNEANETKNNHKRKVEKFCAIFTHFHRVDKYDASLLSYDERNNTHSNDMGEIKAYFEVVVVEDDDKVFFDFFDNSRSFQIFKSQSIKP